jgi:hypothetical protein
MSNFVYLQNQVIVIFHEQAEYKLTVFSDTKKSCATKALTIISNKKCCPSYGNLPKAVRIISLKKGGWRGQ